MTERVCVKVDNLRKIGYESLEDWLEDTNNLYTGRHGRIFITTNGEKKIFHYSGSIFANPYKVDKKGKNGEIKKLDGNVTECVEKYEKYILGNAELLGKVKELKGKKLGCFCSGKECHVNVLLKLINKDDE